MGTRGLFGFRKNGIDKAMYNHYDSYPDYLGRNVIDWLQNVSTEKLNEIFDKIVLVDADEKPNETEKAELKEGEELYGGDRNNEDWYWALHALQGNPSLIEKIADTYGKVYMTDDISFIKESVFCEYAYIINLDEDVLEFWKGFQTKPWSENRYGTDAESGVSKDYYPCKRISILRFGDIADIPTDSLVECLNVFSELNEKANEGEK